MKRYLVTLIFHYGKYAKAIQYWSCAARSEKSARAKAKKYSQTHWELRYSLMAIDIVNVSLIAGDTAKEFNNQLIQLEREIEVAELFLDMARRRKYDIKKQIAALKD